MTTTATMTEDRSRFDSNLLRTRQTYWESLEETSKKKCMGRILHQQYNGKFAWDIDGCLQQHWNNEIDPAVKRLYNDEQNKAQIYKKYPAATTLSIHLYLLGSSKAPETAKPTIVVVSSSQKIASRTVKLLKNHEEMKKFRLGFGIIAHQERIIIVADTEPSSVPHEDSSPFTTLCGARILSSLVPVNKSSHGKRSTLDGTLTIAGRYYGLTVAHTFLQGSEYSNNDSEHSFSEDGEECVDTNTCKPNPLGSERAPTVDDTCEVCGTQILTSYCPKCYTLFCDGCWEQQIQHKPGKVGPEGRPHLKTLPESLIDESAMHSGISASYLEVKSLPLINPESAFRRTFANTESSTALSLIGHTDTRTMNREDRDFENHHTSSKWFSLSLDWALIEIQDSRLMLPNDVSFANDEFTVSFVWPRDHSPDEKLLVLAGVTGPGYASALGGYAGISLPWSRNLVDARIIEYTCGRGDCGAWVVDADRGGLFGIVIASSSDSNLTYVLPAENIIDDIKLRWKDFHESSADLFPIKPLKWANFQEFEVLTHSQKYHSEGAAPMGTTNAQIYESTVSGIGKGPSFERQDGRTISTREPGQEMHSNTAITSNIPISESRFSAISDVPKAEQQQQQQMSSGIALQQLQVQPKAKRKPTASHIAERQAPKLLPEIEILSQSLFHASDYSRDSGIDIQTEKASIYSIPLSISRSPDQPQPYPISSFNAASTFEERHPVDRPGFESKLSKLAGQFADIRASDHKACYNFIQKYPAILQVDFREFLGDAYVALDAGKDAYANCCVQRAVVLQECVDSSDEDIQKFFAGLINKKPKALASFMKDRDDAMINLKTILKAKHSSNAQRSALQNTLSQPEMSGPPPRNVDRHFVEPRPVGGYPIPTKRPHIDSSDRRISGGGYSRPVASAATRGHGATSDDPTQVGPDGQGSTVLDTDYQVRREATKFFTVGRVFATAWHQSLGASAANTRQSPWVTYDRLGEPILTHIQRMAVVKEGHGFCWCVPINSYNGKGVANSGLSNTDRDAHAIIYMESTLPSISEAEHGMMSKRPIAVGPAAADRKLDAMSRINFSKVQTIEHNVKVKNVGNIRGNELKTFEEYWDETSGEPNRMRDR